MQLFLALRAGVLLGAVCLGVQGQDTPSSEAQIEAKGLPPRAAPTEYQAQAQTGAVTIAAEFTGHSISTLQGVLTTEEYVVVETGLYGPAGTRVTLSCGDFSLRINGRKTALPGQPFGLVIGSVKDPEWEPPESASKKSKTRVGGGGQDEQRDANEPPPVVKVPVPVQRAMAKRVQAASLPEGDRALPQAGLLFFEYRGKTQSIRSIELIYDGPAGKATLKLQP